MLRLVEDMNMKKLAIAALAALIAAVPAAAQERHRHWEGSGPAWDDGRGQDWQERRGGGTGDLVLGGVAGLVSGIVIGGMISDRPRVEYVPREPRFHVETYPRYVGPGRSVRTEILRPWSPRWYRWCMATYRSFDPDTGTFLGRDGLPRFCVALRG